MLSYNIYDTGMNVYVSYVFTLRGTPSPLTCPFPIIDHSPPKKKKNHTLITTGMYVYIYIINSRKPKLIT